MKYSETNPPLVCMQTQSTCYKGTRRMQIKGVLWHDTGANNPNLKRYVQPSDSAADRGAMLALIGKNKYGNDWNHVSRQAGMNCWIGRLADGTVTTVQTMPWDYRPWGCGKGSKGSCNDGWIQFEICEDGKNDPVYFQQVYREACEITAYLCRLYGIDPKGTAKCGGVTVPTILCHADSHKLGLGSNHSDVYDWFTRYGVSMDTVRADVAALLAEGQTDTPEVQETAQDGANAVQETAQADNGAVHETAKTDTPAVPETAPVPFLVKVSIDNLSIYRGPGLNYVRTGVYTGKGVFTILEVRQGQDSIIGWGRLKSGAGWINLDFCSKKS